MPKKFHGENTKAVEARARKAAQKEEETERKKQAEADAYWEDDDKLNAKKAQRKEEKLKKQQEALSRKQENRSLLEKETDQINSKGLPAANKVTQADIFANQERIRQQKLKEEEKAKLEQKNIVVQDDLLTENVNRLELEGEQARNVDDALRILNDNVDSADKHPEKRMKSAYAAYEEKYMAQLKAENPNLRLSQLRQMLKKQWQKAPENPMNQRPDT